MDDTKNVARCSAGEKAEVQSWLLTGGARPALSRLRHHAPVHVEVHLLVALMAAGFAVGTIGVDVDGHQAAGRAVSRRPVDGDCGALVPANAYGGLVGAAVASAMEE